MYTLQYLLPYVIFKQSSAVNRLQVNQLSGNFLDKSGEPMNCINYRITTHVQCSLHVCNIIMDSSSSSSVSSQIVSPSTETSLVWKHFGFPVDDKGKIVKDSKVVCKLCNQKIAHGGGTTNLRTHLKAKHRSMFDQLFPSSSSENQSSIDAFLHPDSVRKLPSNSARVIQLTDAIVDFISIDLRPVSVVDGHGFLKLMHVAEPQFSVPCRKTVMDVIERKYTELKRNVRGSISGEHYITLTTDMWTSRAGDGYFSLTAHYINADFKINHSSLVCQNMPGSHDHTHLSGD